MAGLLLEPAVVFAQTINSNSSLAFPILTLGVGPRAVGMGGSFAAVADDFSAVQYNPAGLAQVANPELTLIHNGYLVDGFYETAGFLDPLEAGTLGIGLSYLNYGNIDQRDSTGAQQGSFTPFDIAVRGGFGFPLFKNVSMGFSSEWMREQISTAAYTALLWNMGILAKISQHLSLGLNLQNIGIETGGYNLPIQLMGGLAYRIPLASKDAESLLLTAGGTVAFQSVNELNAGFEFTFLRNYFLRSGYALETQDQQLGSGEGLNLGAGVRMGEFQLDYSFSFEGDLGNLQTFSVTAIFQPFVKPVSEVKAAAPVTIFVPALPTSAMTSIVPGAGSAAGVPGTLASGLNGQPGLSSGAVTNSVSGDDDKRPVMLKFQITSQDDMTAQQLFDQAEDKLKLGLKKEAQDLYLQVVQKDPNFDKAWSRLARLYFDESMDSYRKVLQLEPENVQLREWLDHFK